MATLFVLGTVVFTVYGQLIIKHQIDAAGSPPEGTSLFPFLVRLVITNPLVLSGFAAAGVASLLWMAALSRLELSYAYPFMALNFVAVVALSAVLFNDALSVARVGGLTLIVAGVLLVASSG